MLLSAARTRVLALVDDAEGVKFVGTTEVDDALSTAQEEVYELIVGTGSGLFTQEASVSSSSAGLVDLTTLRPLKIVSLSQVTGGARLAIFPSQYEPLQNYAAIETLKIVYAPRPTFPASAGTAFAWGHTNVTAVKRFESLMCMLAASELKVKEGERNGPLTDRIATLRQSVEDSVTPSGWAVIPLAGYPGGTTSRLKYTQTAPDNLQLVF